MLVGCEVWGVEAVRLGGVDEEASIGVCIVDGAVATVGCPSVVRMSSISWGALGVS